MRAAAPILLLALLAGGVPLATAELCVAARTACVADDPYRDPSLGCDGTWWVTGAWVSVAPGYAYAWGERRDCTNGWSGMGGQGVRVGVVVAGLDAEARWYEHAGGSCGITFETVGFHAGAPCVARPPPVPWGSALP